MDAASNNSVEDIRGIKEKVNFLPTLAKYRVYIIDEVHMLSTGAFNALLKTLEEPPEHVKFILATTEPQKLLATILSRCQRFDFKKISEENIVKRLKTVCKESNIEITEGALNLIATLSEGAARDALSILERCTQDGKTNIDEDQIKDLVGIPKFIYVNNIIKSIIEKDVDQALEVVNEILEEGKDLENFVFEMIKHTKDILMCKVSQKIDLYNKEEITKIKEIAEKATKEELINIIYRLSELENKMKISTQKTIIFETEIIKLCVKIETKGLEERILALEKKLDKGNFVNTNINQVKNTYKETSINIQDNKYTETIQNNITNSKKKKTTKNEAIEPEKLQEGEVIAGWTKVMNNLKEQGKIMLYANLIDTEAVMINDMTVAIRFNKGLNNFRKELLQKPENMNILTKEISIICGKAMQIKLEAASSTGTKTKQTINIETKEKQEEPEDILENLDIPINIIEE